MRLLYLTHSLSDIDGVGVYGSEVLRRIAPKCDSVRVLIARRHRGVSSRVPSNVQVEVALPPDYLLYVGWPKFLAYCAVAVPKVRKAARDADLIHCLSDYPHAMLGVRAAKRLGKPAIVSGHGTYSVAPFRYKGHRRLISKAYADADHVLLGSRFALSRVEEQIRLPNARVVRYGVDPGSYSRPDQIPRPTGFDRRYVLTIGELKERKGHHISIPAFLQAAKDHPDVDLVIVGNRPEGHPYLEARRAEIAAAGMTDRVRMIGNVDESEKAALLAHAEVFLLTPVTSQEGGFEAFGLVFLEANACGVPTVGIRDSGAQDAILDEETGLLADKDDVDGVAHRLGRLLADPALRARLGARGETWAGENTWDRTAAEIEGLYAGLLPHT